MAPNRSCNKSQIEVGATIPLNFASIKVFAKIIFRLKTPAAPSRPVSKELPKAPPGLLASQA